MTNIDRFFGRSKQQPCGCGLWARWHLCYWPPFATLKMRPINCRCDPPQSCPHQATIMRAIMIPHPLCIEFCLGCRCCPMTIACNPSRSDHRLVRYRKNKSNFLPIAGRQSLKMCWINRARFALNHRAVGAIGHAFLSSMSFRGCLHARRVHADANASVHARTACSHRAKTSKLAVQPCANGAGGGGGLYGPVSVTTVSLKTPRLLPPTPTRSLRSSWAPFHERASSSSHRSTLQRI